MRNFALKSLAVALVLSACGETPKEPAKPTEPVKAVEVEVENNGVIDAVQFDVPIPQARLNYLVGRAAVSLQAIPEQLGDSCQTLTDVREFGVACRPGINAIAKSATFTADNCVTAEKPPIKGALTCSGAIQTEIGSGSGSAVFINRNETWHIRKGGFTLESWTAE